VNVRPHPHIGLATVTYLYEGAFMHRDSLGTAQLIEPGDVNWMVAGRGIAHSERTPDTARDADGRTRAHGIQTWVALPRAYEEGEPSFQHHPGASLPHLERPGVSMRVIAGTAFGVESPVEVLAPTLYVDVALQPDAELIVDDEHAERACYVVSGAIEIDGARYIEGQFVVFVRDVPVTVRALDNSRVLLAGGAPLDGPRHIWWNFVSSSLERIDSAKRDWRELRFAAVPGDPERIPLPE
jgi:redox-sensitive bicupin YhaK (pirin superfamily)